MGAPTPRVPARWAVSRLLAVLTSFVLVGVPATVLAPTVVVQRAVPGQPGTFEIVVGAITWQRWAAAGVLAVALAAGLLLARRAHRLLGDRLAALPPQPERVIRRPGWGTEAWLAAAVVLATVTAWAEASGAMALYLSPGLVALALLLLPRTLVLRRAAEQVGWLAPDAAELAWSDLTWLGRFDRPVRIDRAIRVIRRWDGPYVPGQVVLGPVPRSEPDPPWPPVPA